MTATAYPMAGSSQSVITSTPKSGAALKELAKLEKMFFPGGAARKQIAAYRKNMLLADFPSRTR